MQENLEDYLWVCMDTGRMKNKNIASDILYVIFGPSVRNMLARKNKTINNLTMHPAVHPLESYLSIVSNSRLSIVSNSESKL